MASQTEYALIEIRNTIYYEYEYYVLRLLITLLSVTARLLTLIVENNLVDSQVCEGAGISVKFLHWCGRCKVPCRVVDFLCACQYNSIRYCTPI